MFNTGPASKRLTQLELTVRNHPGVMSHICGLFSRRAFNLEGIMVMPLGDGTASRMWLLVDEDQRLDQMIKQAEKLHDVYEVHRRPADQEDFQKLQDLFMEDEE